MSLFAGGGKKRPRPYPPRPRPCYGRAMPACTPTEKTVEPDLGTALIAKERYTTVEFMRREWERMWTRVWLLAGREADVARPGD